MKRATTYTLLRAFVLGAFLVLIGRLWYMQIVEVKAYRATAVENRTITRPLYAERGILYDRHGIPLVRNLPELDVTVIPGQWDRSRGNAESRLLARLLRHHPGAHRIRWMVWHAIHTWPFVYTTPVIIRSGITYRQFLLIESHANQLPGVSAETTVNRRHYLDQPPWSLSHIIGFTGTIDPQQCEQFTGAANCVSGGSGPWAYQRYTGLDSVGQAGLEHNYEHVLHGVNGLAAAQINAAGDQVTPWRTVSPAKPGDGLRLTIDLRLQQQVARDVRQAMRKNGWPYGAAVVMNPWNGQILAMVSMPSFDANIFTEPWSYRKSRQLTRLGSSRLHPFFDNAFGGAYPPGSIYKIVTATAGLASGVITPSSIVDDTGQLQRYPGARIFYGWYGPGLGPVNVVRAIEESSDIFFYQVAGGGPDIPGNGLGPRRLGRWAKRYGLGQSTGVQLGDDSGIVPSPSELKRTQHRPWSYGDSYNMGIGQGDNLVTPIQMARVASVIANGGSLVRPTLLEGITGPDGIHFLPGKNFAAVPDVVRPHFVPSWITSLIGQGMRLGVTAPIGTSYGEVDQRTGAAGKTGTAQDYLASGLKTTDAWWIGFAPYNHPRIAVAVVFPHADSEGAFAAAPVASKIILDFEHKRAPGWLDNVITKLDFLN